jgi:hypothetical protein
MYFRKVTPDTINYIYKLFSRVITNRLARRLDEFQPPKLAGFRSGYSTIDHIHTVRQIIQKTNEYSQPMCLALVDYEKAFDSVEIWSVLESLQRCQVDWRYIQVMKCLYKSATMSVQVQNQQTKPAPLHRGVIQERHLPETVHKCYGGYIQDAELERTWHQYMASTSLTCDVQMTSS